RSRARAGASARRSPSASPRRDRLDKTGPMASLQRPDFLVVGAPRCGTTALHYYLAQHPGIAMTAIKEPNFFLFDGPGDPRRPLVDDKAIITKSVSDPAEYDRLFRDAGP